MKGKIRHGGVVKGDADKCDATFVTYSVASKARPQAISAGWVRVKATAATKSDSKPIAGGFGSKQVDLCPTCKPRPAMEGAA